MTELHRFTMVYAICLVILGAFSINGQKNYEELQVDKIFIQKRLVQTEWSTPIFINEKTEVLPKKVEIIDDVEIQTNHNKLPKEIIISVDLCKSQATKNINQRFFALRTYTTYSVKDRIFAYRVPAAYVFVRNQRLERVLATTVFHYVDEDGSGNFRLCCDSSLKLIEFPEWVKTLGKLPVVKKSK